MIVTKETLRKEARALLKQFSRETIAAHSHRVCNIISAQIAWRHSRSVLLYAALPAELDLWPLFRAAKQDGKTIALPRFDSATGTYLPAEADESSLIRGAFGALEPPSGARIIKTLDFILVPGLAFDLQGRRLGRGKGFYDRILSEIPGVKCGVAFDEQILPRIPAEAHDVSVDLIATPSRWLVAAGKLPHSDDGH